MCAAIAAAAVISAAAVASSTAGLRCPGGTVHLDGPFDFNQTSWVACEDLTVPGGAMALVSARGDTEWFEKGFAPYGTAATDEDCKIPRPGLRPQSVAMLRRGVVLLASRTAVLVATSTDRPTHHVFSVPTAALLPAVRRLPRAREEGGAGRPHRYPRDHAAREG